MPPVKRERPPLPRRFAPRPKAPSRKPIGLGTLAKSVLLFLGFVLVAEWIYYGHILPDLRSPGGSARPIGEPEATGTPPTAPESSVAPPTEEKNPDLERIRQLPSLSASTATPELLERAKELARRNPDVPWLRAYVANTHLWVASDWIERRLYAEAERLLDEAEAWGAPPGEVAAHKARIHLYQRSWEAASRWAREAIRLETQTNRGQMHYILGRAHYFRQELARAIEEYERALSYGDHPDIRAAIEEALRDQRTSPGYEPRRVAHFVISYEGGTMESMGRMAIDTLERAHASLVSELGFAPSDPVAVVLYTRQSYREYDGTHYRGGRFDGKIRLPVKDIRWGDEYIAKTLRHELAHAFFQSGTRGRHDPRWLNEGLAEYASGLRARDVQAKLAPHLEGGGTLEPCLTRTLYNCPVFYPAATSLVSYLVEVRGMGGIRDILGSLGAGEDVDGALRRFAGKDQSSLIRDWEAFVRRR